jgi:F-type H+-transporting ATPase subunit b
VPELKFPFILEHPAEYSDVQWLIVRGIGFVLVFLVFWKFVRPMIVQPLRERQGAIITTAEQVEQTLRETEEMRNDYRARLTGIQEETERRLQEAVREAEDLSERILAEARNTANSLARRGEDEVARERAKAMVTMRSQFVEGVIDAAEYAAARSIDDGQRKRLVGEFVTELANGSGTRKSGKNGQDWPTRGAGV